MRTRAALTALITGLAAALSACTVGAPGLGAEAGPTYLPTGLTMLEAEETHCDGAVHFGEGAAASDHLGDEFFVEPGQNATFRLERPEASWVCIAADERDYQSLECPRQATHVRLTRAAEGGRLLAECFG